MNNFHTRGRGLTELLTDIGMGRIQLPDFQRDWLWQDEDIRSLIASVSQSFPIGSVMILETGGSDVHFKPRLIEGVEPRNAQKEPDELILDGQQRLTALYQTLKLEAVSTRGKKSQRYYLDMKKCVEGNTKREDAILSLGEDRIVKSFRGGMTLDLSSLNSEYENDMFPVHQLFEPAEWRGEYNRYWQYDSKKGRFFDQFEAKVIRQFRVYYVPVTPLSRDTPREAICLVFKKVNTAGVTLTVFELLTAFFAAEEEGFSLREEWKKTKASLEEFKVLTNLSNVNFLKVVTLLATNAAHPAKTSCKNTDILRLTVSEHKEWSVLAKEGFEKAARFLHARKIFDTKSLPYPAQLVPLAAILAHLGRIGETKPAKDKLARWYWCGVFGELYGSSADTRFANDFREVTAWIKGETTDEPRTIVEANFQEDRLNTLRTRGSAAYKGIYALLMHEGCQDFRTGETVGLQTYFEDEIDIHHIFPRAWCEEQQEIEPDDYNSIINKTPLSSYTNKIIGGKAPSEYLRKFEQSPQQNSLWISESEKDPIMEILDSHLICPDTLRNNDFQGFFEARKEALLKAIEEAMGKKSHREGDNPPDAPA